MTYINISEHWTTQSRVRNITQKMTSNSNFGSDRGGHRQDLREWMINQQRQFQEFDRSFGMPSAFGSSFGSFGDSFDPFFSSPFPSRVAGNSLLFSPTDEVSSPLVSPSMYHSLDNMLLIWQGRYIFQLYINDPKKIHYKNLKLFIG